MKVNFSALPQDDATVDLGQGKQDYLANTQVGQSEFRLAALVSLLEQGRSHDHDDHGPCTDANK